MRTDLDASNRDIFASGHVVANKILEEYANIRAERVGIVFAQVDAVQQNATFGRVVQTRQQFYQRRFSSAVFANQCDDLASSCRRNEPAKNVRSPMLNSPATVRHTMKPYAT